MTSNMQKIVFKFFSDFTRNSRTVITRTSLTKRYHHAFSSLMSYVPTERNDECLLCAASDKNYFSNSLRFFSLDTRLPPHHKVALPALSPTMEKGTIVSWEKKEGDKLNEGDLLAEIETDKATMGFETPEEGYLAKILVPAGAKDVPLGRLLCIIVSNEEDIMSFKNYVDASENETSAAQTSPKAEQASSPAETPSLSTPSLDYHPASDPVKKKMFAASPLAKKVAAEKGIDLSVVQGSGPGGRIRIKDIDVLSSQGTPKHSFGDVSSSFIDIPLTSMRKIIAHRLLQSKQTIPHYYLSVNINMKHILKIRAKFNEILNEKQTKLSVNDFIIKAASLACKKVPESNSSWQDGFIRRYNRVDINIAVSTEAGLITPIVFDADKKGLFEISQETRVLAAKAREGKLKPEEFQGGTFTISNLGMFGVKNFSAVINPPQACILAVGAIEDTVVADSSEECGYCLGNVMDVTLSCDHRVIDGAVGAQWLLHFKKLLEMPESMLL